MRTFRIILGTFLVSITAVLSWLQYALGNNEAASAYLMAFALSIIILIIFIKGNKTFTD